MPPRLKARVTVVAKPPRTITQGHDARCVVSVENILKYPQWAHITSEAYGQLLRCNGASIWRPQATSVRPKLTATESSVDLSCTLSVAADARPEALPDSGVLKTDVAVSRRRAGMQLLQMTDRTELRIEAASTDADLIP